MSTSSRIAPRGLAVLVLLVLPLAAHAAVSPTRATRAMTTTTAATVARVQIKNFTFTPHTLRIRVGTTVVWTNLDANVGHTVTSGNNNDAHVWRSSGILSQGQRFSVTFRKPGTYAYYCMPHYFQATMHGVVIVTR